MKTQNICVTHFLDGDFTMRLAKKHILKWDAVPTVYLEEISNMTHLPPIKANILIQKLLPLAQIQCHWKTELNDIRLYKPL